MNVAGVRGHSGSASEYRYVCSWLGQVLAKSAEGRRICLGYVSRADNQSIAHIDFRRLHITLDLGQLFAARSRRWKTADIHCRWMETTRPVIEKGPYLARSDAIISSL